MSHKALSPKWDYRRLAMLGCDYRQGPDMQSNASTCSMAGDYDVIETGSEAVGGRVRVRVRVQLQGCFGVPR